MEAVEDAEYALRGASKAIHVAVAAGRWQGRVFADFEAHTRGIGSKLLASMGYVAGTGLGRDRQGISAALQIQVGTAPLCSCQTLEKLALGPPHEFMARLAGNLHRAGVAELDMETTRANLCMVG